MSLAERLRALREQDIPLVADIVDDDAARLRLQTWKTQPPFDGDPRCFLARLSQDGLDEAAFAALLALPAEHVPTSAPSWLTTLHTALLEWRGGVSAFPAIPQQADPELLAVFEPLLAFYIERLQAGLQTLVSGASPSVRMPFDVSTMALLCRAQLPGRLLPKAIKTLALELNVARLRQQLHGDTAQARFHDFIARLGQPGALLALFDEYPALARALVETLEQWLGTCLELAERLGRDWPEICAIFPQARQAGALSAIQAGQGDFHRGGRSVCVLLWDNGFRLVYKPRSMAVDRHFQALLTWLNGQGFAPGFRTLQVIDQGHYGWSEWVACQSVSSQSEVARFYQRQGAYLALLHVLEATDFHAENLIASGEHPMLVDLEALLQPRPPLRDAYRDDSAARAMAHSVLRVGLLPRRLWSGADAAGIDISGLGAQRKQRSPVPLPAWMQRGTDEMHLGEQAADLVVGGGAHRPVIGGQEVDVLAFRDDVVAGFSHLYRLMMRHRAELLAHWLPQFAGDEIRCIFRNTYTYAKILTDSYHPDVLRDALDRDRVLDRLWINADRYPHLQRLVLAERTDLHAGDIPVFTSTPASRDLFTSRGECIPAFFETCALDEARQRVNEMSEPHLAQQVWMIEGAFASVTLGFDGPAKTVPRLRSAAHAASPSGLLAAAKAVGDRLQVLALHHENDVGWLGVALVHEREWHLAPAGIDLYSGVPGIALFLAYLGVLSEDAQYTALARHAVAPSPATLAAAQRCGDHLIAHARQMPTGLAWGDEGKVPLTGFSHGAAGVGWSLLRLYQATGEMCFRDAALAAMDYERSLFEPGRQNWRDLRHDGPDGTPAFMVAWCHGAPGIALGRLDTLAVADDASIRADIADGVRTTLASGFAGNHSLCHGALGNLEAVAVAAEVLGCPQYQSETARLSAMLLESITRQGWITAIPQGVETPGLMVGIAGIGYGLLRLGFPARVPSVLLLRPPASAAGAQFMP